MERGLFTDEADPTAPTRVYDLGVHASAVPPPLDLSAFEAYRAEVLHPGLLDRLASVSELSIDEVRSRVDTSLAESAQTLRMFDGIHLEDRRIIEVGSGLGLTSCYLARLGHDITSLEPGGQGFEWHSTVTDLLIESLESPLIHLDIPAEALNVEEHGRFDVVFSMNVIEHVDDPIHLLVVLAGLLSPGGVMIHSCPNYSVPFEPHFGIPLLPIRPATTARLLPSRISTSGLWNSLNLIRARDVETAASQAGMDVEFTEGILADSLERLGTDEQFAQRHRLLARVWRTVERTGAPKLVRRIPAPVVDAHGVHDGTSRIGHSIRVGRPVTR